MAVTPKSTPPKASGKKTSSVTPSTGKKGGAAAAASPTGTVPRRRVTFKLDAPSAGEVYLCGTFNDWEPGRHGLKKDASGTWRAQVNLTPGTYEYRYVVDGDWVDDPDAAWKVPNPFGGENCVKSV